MSNISHIRKDYSLQSLNEADVTADAIAQFNKWWNDALVCEIEEVNAMTLATATADGRPNARIVLLKDFDEKGFVFFTNYHSNKAKQMEENPFAYLVFFWKELERQVRIEGKIEKIASQESDTYFQSRPVGSQIGAWASPQSSIIATRDIIEENVSELEKSFANKQIDRPPHWGGYIVKPVLIEFWQGRKSRLHDRLQYTLLPDGAWKLERLAP